MPWRTFTNAAFETTETTDMSTAKLEAMLNDGWWQTGPLETELAKLCRGYGVGKVRDTLAELVEHAARGQAEKVEGELWLKK